MTKLIVILCSAGLLLWAAYKIVPALFVLWVVTHYFVIFEEEFNEYPQTKSIRPYRAGV
jgi:hypothetical protein